MNWIEYLFLGFALAILVWGLGKKDLRFVQFMAIWLLWPIPILALCMMVIMNVAKTTFDAVDGKR